MPSKQILAVAAFAASASANFMPIARRDFVEARAADSGDDACSTALGQILPIYTEIPYPPKELLTVTIPTDPCETPDITGSLAAEYTSYTSKVLGWYSLHSAELLSALTGCSELAGYATEVPVCSTAAVASAYPTATESAPEETGYASSGSGSGSGDSGSGDSGSDSGDSGSSSGGDSYDASGSGSGDESSTGSGSGDESSGSDESSSSGSEESGSSSGIFLGL
ncbi:hypothetical protein G7054_g15108 [Neopestalotiopsis clavispora]|nr:hypothetical protein G7054_g15108 [Neopestalotiopsis clavispora]